MVRNARHGLVGTTLHKNAFLVQVDIILGRLNGKDISLNEKQTIQLVLVRPINFPTDQEEVFANGLINNNTAFLKC